MRVLLTSFEHAPRLRGQGVSVYSAAVYQPKGMYYEKADWADIRDASGKWIRPREFVDHPFVLEGGQDPLAMYHGRLLQHYTERHDQIEAWFDKRRPFWGSLALCCWCPYERAAQRQLKEHGTYVCHTAVIGEVLEEQHGIQVFYDHDRRLMKVLP